MAKFYRFETIDIPLVFTPSGVLSGYRHIVVSIAQNGKTKINKTEEDLTIDNDTITVSLSQEETSKFIGGKETPGLAEIQVNIYYEDEERDVSTIGTIDIYDNLYDEVIVDE